jgi:hypothetical protein
MEIEANLLAILDEDEQLTLATSLQKRSLSLAESD